MGTLGMGLPEGCAQGGWQIFIAKTVAQLSGTLWNDALAGQQHLSAITEQNFKSQLGNREHRRTMQGRADLLRDLANRAGSRRHRVDRPLYLGVRKGVQDQAHDIL